MNSITSTPRKVGDVRTTGVPMVMVVIYQSALASQPNTYTNNTTAGVQDEYREP